MTWPLPWQVGQVRSTVKKPWDALTAPAPPQVPQALGCDPGLAPVPLQISQAVAVGTLICAVLPENASVTGETVVKLRKGLRQGQVREGVF